MELNEQQIEELEEPTEQARKQESEGVEAIKAADFKQKKLKKDLAKKNKELRDQLGLGTTKSKKGVQFGDLPKGEKPKKGKKPEKGKDKDKKAEKDQSTSGRDDPGDDSSSSSESSNGGKSGSEDESEANTRKVRQLSPSEKE